MADRSPRDVDWPTRRWLLWGAIALAGLIAIVLLITWWANARTGPVEEAAEEGNLAPQVEWSVALTDQSGQTVTLKADEPDGVITETWIDEEMIERGAGDQWVWNMDAGQPQPVVDIAATTDCTALNEILDEWLQGVEAALGDVFNWQARAFAQETLNQMRAQSCEIDDSILTGL